MASFADGIGDGFGALFRLAGCAVVFGVVGFLVAIVTVGYVSLR